MKRCTVCKEQKPLDDFYNSKKSSDGKGYRCKECDNATRRRYLKNRSELAKAKSRLSHLKSKHGVEAEAIAAMMDRQRGCCCICGDTLINPNHNCTYAVDHNHSTGQIRGLLCMQCNIMLGGAGDNPEVLENAVTYLQQRGHSPKRDCH